MNVEPLRRRESFLVFGSPQIEDADIESVVECLRSGWIGTGPRTHRFEAMFRDYKRSEHAIAVGSCTAALHLSMLVMGLNPGDEVITTPLTFCATVNAIIHAGGTPVLADIDPVTMNLTPKQVESKITSRTRAIVVVHFGGRPCDMDEICEIANRNNITLIEDCAHAIESRHKGRETGTFGRFGCFSFYATKTVVTGEGGMVLARNKDDADAIRTLALHGLSKDAWKRFGDDCYQHYSVVDAGFKYNMTDIQASLGIHQLGRVETNWCRRQEVWQRYTEAFADLPVTLPAPPKPETRHAYHLYTLLIDPSRARMGRDEFLSRMTEERIGVGVHYTSLTEHPYYQERFGWRPEDLPNAMSVGRQTVSLPLSAKLTNEDVADVISATRRALVG